MSKKVLSLTCSKDDIFIFLYAWSELNRYEGSQRTVRGYGAFNDEEIKRITPHCLRVVKCLESLLDSDVRELLHAETSKTKS